MGSIFKTEPLKGYISIREFAEMLNTTRRTVYNILLRDGIKTKRHDGHTYIEKKSAMEFKKNRVPK